MCNAQNALLSVSYTNAYPTYHRETDRHEKCVMIYLQEGTIVVSDIDRAHLGQKKTHEVGPMVFFSEVCLKKNSRVRMIAHK